MARATSTTRRRACTATLAAAVALLVAGCGDSAPKRDAAGHITKSGETRLLTLRTGDCVGDLRNSIENPDGLHNGVPKVNAVPCDQPHDGEVLLISRLGSGPWPGSAIVDGAASSGHSALQPRLAKASSASRPLQLYTFRPTQPRWDFEHQHEILFLVLDARPRRGAFQ